MPLRTLAATALSLLLLAGCGVPVGLRTQSAPISACMDALATGVLVTSNLSGLAIRGGEDGVVTEVEWPFEYTFVEPVPEAATGAKQAPTAEARIDRGPAPGGAGRGTK